MSSPSRVIDHDIMVYATRTHPVHLSMHLDGELFELHTPDAATAIQTIARWRRDGIVTESQFVSLTDRVR